MPHIKSHFGVYALITNDLDNQILLIKKARGPYTGMFDLPGGSPEDLELLEDILIREVKEETDCEIVSYYQLGAVSARFPYKREGEDAIMRHIGVIYKAEIEGIPKTDADGLDSNGCVWIDIESLSSDAASPFVFEALRLYKK